MTSTVPIVLFAYTRCDCLASSLLCLKANKVPLIYAFSDGWKGEADKAAVQEVRRLLHQVDWCDLEIIERERNYGLGVSVRTGVTEVLKEHDRLIVMEDDLICVDGAYQYLCQALERYADESQVMSVTGWTHPAVTPSEVVDQPYFDGRAECWMWGTWRRAWEGMKKTALQINRECMAHGIDPCAYGADLPAMAEEEERKNIWAVRFLMLHILQGGICLRPPWSMVEHIGFDNATNAAGAVKWRNPPLKNCPLIPEVWPMPLENPKCRKLWQKARGSKTTSKRVPFRLKAFARDLTPPLIAKAWRNLKKSKEVVEWECIGSDWPSDADQRYKGWDVPEVAATCQRSFNDLKAVVKGRGPVSGLLRASDGLAAIEHNIRMTFGFVLSCVARDKEKISILDWGGGLGEYRLLAEWFLPGVEVDYHCRDLSKIVAAGKVLSPTVHFYDDDLCLERCYDLVMVSASLHYEKNWANLLKKLVSASKRHVYVAQLPVVEGSESFVFIQRPYSYGYNTEYIGWCLKRHDFLHAASQAGLHMEKEFLYGHCPKIQGAPETNEYKGFLFSKG